MAKSAKIISVLLAVILRDYARLIPVEYANDSEKLHFNLLLTADFQLGM